MAQEELKFTIPANAKTGQPAIAVDIILTISNTANSDGSYTVTSASGTYGALQVIGVTAASTDGSDNKLFLNGQPFVDFGGITFVTNGTPNAAGTGPAADVNFFYTGTGATPNNVYAVDTATPSAVTTGSVSVNVICFMPGTMIRTPTGEVAVETLERGDPVVTADGRAQPVRWIGRRTVSTHFADPLRVLPIRIKAGALGESAPSRDLLVSPDHAIFVGDALIHAGALVNSVTIVRETRVPTVFTYYHVELDDHALILAENVPAETFVDNVDRGNFDNWVEHEALYPGGKAIAELPHARVKAHRQVPARIRALLAARAELMAESLDPIVRAAS
ncbi:Hint domain-containing protein [Rhodoblastus sp.]|uniref:Hint domain-containing protein n=1 Tax=Rhodoblastus sp. TaxID=1962975 RepID=UPI0035B4E9C4